MLDKEIINKHLNDLDIILSNLKKHQNIKPGDLKNNLDLVWTIEHGLQLAIQNIIDIGGYILTTIGENNINNYTDIIERLGEKSIIDKEFSLKIKGMPGFRNILVHEYISVDIDLVCNVLKNDLDDFIKFAEYIKDYLST